MSIVDDRTVVSATAAARRCRGPAEGPGRAPIRTLIWQWGRRGAGPRIAVECADALRSAGTAAAMLSLSRQAEIMTGAAPPPCSLPVSTYRRVTDLPAALLRAPVLATRMVRFLRSERIDAALCAMPAMLDLVMQRALHRARVPYAVIVHDAIAHPGDGLPLQARLQRWLIKRADAVVAPSAHVADMLRTQPETAGKPVTVIPLPPLRYGAPPAPRLHGGGMRLLFFGRLLPYKGLDLLAAALAALPAGTALSTRVIGQGPESPVLAALRTLPGVTVENRWVAEDEIEQLLAWSDALVLPYTEASQSGTVAVALAARRPCIVTRVGGLPEQVRDGIDGLVTDPDPAALVAAIQALAAQPIIPPPPSWSGGKALLSILRGIAVPALNQG